MKKKFNKRIIILVPLTIPSSGKSSTFKRLAESQQIQVQLVSSDTCREQVMKDLKIKNPNLSHTDLFQKSGKGSKTLFKKYLSQAFNKLQNSKYQCCLLVLDKNHPSNALPGTIQEIDEIRGNRNNVKILGLVPVCDTKFSLNGNVYPFSLQYLVTCLIRAINRQSHQTLIGDGPQRARIVLSFFNMFSGVQNNKQQLSKYFDGLLALTMFNQNIPDLTPQIKDLINQILSYNKPGSFNDTPYTPSLVQKLSTIKLNQIPVQTIVKQNTQRIKQLFQNFENIRIQN